ncbi:MAG: multidrug efflux SMR transporter [Lachnospiraceae bacterium]|nr:multidrug efflux SMR transporter [Lachnospiraceae bacterium]
MEWIWLLFAGVLEVTWAVAMKASNGFKVFIPSAITVVGYILSAVFLAMALKKLPIGTAYAMWTGFGIVGTYVLGVLMFNEKISLPQVICIVLIISGIVGLKLLGK